MPAQSAAPPLPRWRNSSPPPSVCSGRRSNNRACSGQMEDQSRATNARNGLTANRVRWCEERSVSSHHDFSGHRTRRRTGDGPARLQEAERSP
ncbi:hypothetical protein JCGZ_16306 [Jatropha curcas]|uniref:Uncharacterized protein n=1 Tax=Jatropha curcas TaxID=180498 RepID=A0A067LB57_JATCU|nr:hypothetical protein JCGZ_16306 [Jatropha curcas]